MSKWAIILLCVTALVSSPLFAAEPDQRLKVSKSDRMTPQVSEIQTVSYLEPLPQSFDAGCVDCGIDSCEGNCPQPACLNWYGGFEATFLSPRFSDNVAYTQTESDGTSFSQITDVEFDYGLDFAPRIFFGAKNDQGIGLRASWWQLDHGADTLTANPPANGFGRISHPTFGTVDISTTVPNSSFTTYSELEAFAIDVEITKETQFTCWQFGIACGLRVAEIDQRYFAQTTNAAGNLTGQIDYEHGMTGFGPTLGLTASVPIANCWTLFANGRGSLLFGDATSQLNAGENLDLTTPFTTTRSTDRDDSMVISELQLGARWQSCNPCGTWHPFASIALEGQSWNDVGNATSESGNLGLFGFSAQAGVNW